MRALLTRRNLMALLLGGTLAAALALWNIERHSLTRLATHDTVAVSFDRISDAVAGIGAAQQSYVAPGQLDQPWFERTSSLVQGLKDEVAAVGPLLGSSDAAGALQALSGSLEALMAADGRTRQNLSLGQDLMASDVIFSDGRNILDGMTAQLRELQGAERAWHRAELASLSRWRWLVLALMALLWVGAFGALAVHPSAIPIRATVVGTHDSTRTAPGEPAATTRTTPVDLAEAAALCTDLARVSDATALSGLLGRAASVLDASGLLLWMSAGEQLFAVLGHGYPVDAVARFGPIARGADNAAAAAWRTGRLTVVPGDSTTLGALVAPMCGPGACIGVLALEIRQGREHDPATQAVAAMVAAQLAAVVSAWPAASLGQAPVTVEAEAQSA